jgi:hypothetical protein
MPHNELGISVWKSACSSEAKDLAVDWGELGVAALLPAILDRAFKGEL